MEAPAAYHRSDGYQCSLNVALAWAGFHIKTRQGSLEKYGYCHDDGSYRIGGGRKWTGAASNFSG